MMITNAIVWGSFLALTTVANIISIPSISLSKATDNDSLKYPQEKYIRNVRMYTFGGDNAESYFSFNGKSIVFQRTDKTSGIPCDQIFMWNLADGPMTAMNPSRVSTGTGRTTCSYFMPGDSLILYASTHASGKDCPPEPSRELGYLWPVYNSFDIYVSDLKGNIRRKLTDRVGYDAEATVSPRGDLIVFTSDRSGDLELWTMRPDGSELRQITTGLGYDGGAFFSPDGSQLVFRASRPQTPEAIEKYKSLLAKGLVAPSDMEIYTCNIDGSNLRQITQLGRANWAPFFHPSGKKIIFSSNHSSEKIYQFNLWMINTDGTGLQQITFDPIFDAFPMFSPDGTKLMFSSNRFNGGTRATNIFVADWVEP
jgi:TolB protein